jgi:hypothetical protein
VESVSRERVEREQRFERGYPAAGDQDMRAIIAARAARA